VDVEDTGISQASTGGARNYRRRKQVELGIPTERWGVEWRSGYLRTLQVSTGFCVYIPGYINHRNIRRNQYPIQSTSVDI
jgi:hypothetical protein